MSKRYQEILQEEKAKKDALYDGDKYSIGSAATAGLTGGVIGNLSTNIAKNVSHAGKSKSILGGALIGAIAGTMNNNSKVNKADRAKEWLAKNEQKKEVLGKESADIPVSGMVPQKRDPNRSEVSKKEMISGAATGASIGAGLGAMLPIGGSRIKTALLGAGAGAIESIVGDSMTNSLGSSKDKGDRALKNGLAFGTAGALSPLIERSAFYADKGWAKKINEGAGEKSGLSKIDKAKTAIRDNASVDSSGAKIAGGAKSLKGAMKGVGKHMLGRGLAAGILGGGISYGLSSLAERKGK